MGIDSSSKVLVITGASSGIGKELSLHFASEEKTVCVLARTEKKLIMLQRKHPEFIDIYPSDVTDVDCMSKVFSEIGEEHGTIDALINNAGTYYRKPFLELSIEEINRMIDVNLKGTIYCTKFALPLMEKGGKVINISSVAGTRGILQESVYSASKHGVIGFGDTISQEVKSEGILVFTLCPGAVNTPLWRKHGNVYDGDLEETMDPEEIVELVDFLFNQPHETIYKRIIFFPQSEWH